MSKLLTAYFAEVEQIQFEESQRLTILLLSLYDLTGNEEVMGLVKEALYSLKNSLTQRKDLLAACKEANKPKRKVR